MLADEFPHHGEHLANDEKMAELTVTLTAALVIFMALAAIIAIFMHG